jgi:fatty acid desaturase
MSVVITTPARGGQRTDPAEHPYTSDFSGLISRVREAGLLARQSAYYTRIIIALSVLMLVTVAAMVWIGASWWQVALAPVMAIVFTQFAFLAHEMAHKQVYEKGATNDRGGKILANLVVGISYSWWMNKHSRHHANPNTVGKDPDIESDVIVFQGEHASKTKGLQRAITKRQGWLFFPLLTLEGLNLHVQGFKRAFSKEPLQGRASEIAMLLVRHGLLFALVFLVMPWGVALVFLATQLAVFGVYMGASFAPNHKGMPIIPRGEKVDFLRRQVLTSRNIRGGRMMDVFMGGLNYQVEHHLFPNMPRPSLAKAAAMVKDYCKEHSISYTETTLWRSYGTVVAYLNRVGLQARDPFDCPAPQMIGR